MILRALSFLALVLVASAAGATSMPERTPAEVAAESDLVVEGTVVASRVARVGGRLVTYHDVVVAAVWRGPDGPRPGRVVVALPGGELQGIGQRVAGTPRLAVGSRYVLCLSAEVLAGARTVVGLWQGAWRVGADGALLPFHHEGPAPVPVSRAALEASLRGAP